MPTKTETETPAVSIPAAHLPLGKRMLAVMAEVGSIEKDAENSFHRYKYASEHAIKAAIQPLLVKHGVLFALAGVTGVTTQEVQTAKATERLYTAVFTWRFRNADDANEFIEVPVPGQGQDAGDKAAYKAVTGSLKYALTSSFVIPTGDDPENEAPQAAAARAAGPRIAPARPSMSLTVPRALNGADDALQAPFKHGEVRDMELHVLTMDTKTAQTGTTYAILQTLELGPVKAWKNTMDKFEEGLGYKVAVEASDFKGTLSYSVVQLYHQLDGQLGFDQENGFETEPLPDEPF